MSSSSSVKTEQIAPAQSRNSGQQALPVPRNRSTAVQWLRMLVITAVIGALYIWRGGASLLVLLSASGILMACGLIIQLFGPKQVRIVRRITPVRPSAGDTLTVEAEVSFSSRIPLPWMIVADYWGGGWHQELLFPGFRRKLAYSYSIEKVPRGVHRIHGCSVSWGDLPGLFTGSCPAEGTDSIKVLPRPLYIGRAVPEYSMLPGDAVNFRQGGGGSGENADIRNYMPGDPLNRIHWKNSARRGTLQSRVPEREQGRMSCIVLANSPENYAVPVSALAPRGRRGSSPPAFEQAVSAAMGLMLAAERSGTYVQLFSGGWPEGIARHEGLGKLPGRVQDMLAEIAPDGTRSLSELLEDASKNWIPGMSVAVITGRLEEEAAKTLARFLVQGVKVELYYAWDNPVPAAGGNREGRRSSGTEESGTGTVSASLERLGARIYCLNGKIPAYGYQEVELHEYPGSPGQR
ncbi:hypothetical protein C2I18_15180 [Paenibacillus sp. PK3_47]|uniref:DUF58 domain-containing protein n=1 Tax=Paenibacillus sp. PK3_47 TaxID=2072642 RepID=UPI00201D7E71|nr:DUF58 domain-containing protein [Paenibacillus sp. PK3_47]UQZ34749.1 hypothetical protein C2I18_15180 [Paenibacillus sp. PK3_47]